MTGLSDRAARMALSCVVDCGEPVVCELVETSGAQQVWAQATEGVFGDPVARRTAMLDLEVLRRRAERAAVRFVVPGDEELRKSKGRGLDG